jgi:DNA (cytosine-5)-methyltransferase 1
MPTIGSLFAGIGGIDLAFQNAGFEIAWQVEIDDFCQKVLDKNFPGITRFRDIFDCHHLPYVDVITAGFPCQPFSVAGKQRGRDDDRFLIPEMIRIIHECQPTVVFLENVPGFASLNDGAEFKALLRTLAEMGFDAQWGHIGASDIGAPHKRERWFCVAYKSVSNTRQKRFVRRHHWRKRRILHHVHRDATPCKSKWIQCKRWTCPTCQVLGKTPHIHLQGRRQTRKRFTPAYARQALSRSASCGSRSASCLESRVVRNFDGFSYRVDRHQFPAHRNIPQYHWEPTRTTNRKDGRTDRIKALGNAVVPQVIYPIAQQIYEYLLGA